MAPPKLPVVALVGRTNVGKSTLFNAILEKKQALVSEVPGTTRDMNQADVEWQRTHFLLVDTGGLVQKTTNSVNTSVQKQSLAMVADADLVCCMIDGSVGVTDDDLVLARSLRKISAKVFVVVNKLDSPRDLLSPATEIYRLGFKHIFLISAMTGAGVGDLLDAIAKRCGAPKGRAMAEEAPIRLALIGKTNTGKSTIMNALVGEERYIVSSTPHTTREPRDVTINWKERDYTFVDTAGLRKERKISDALERTTVLMSRHAIESVHIAVVVTDVTQTLTMHDLHVINLAVKAKKGIIILANKWDLIQDKTHQTLKKYTEYYRRALPMIPWAPIIFTSALNRQRIVDLFPLAQDIRRLQLREIPQNDLQHFLLKLITRHPPGQRLGKKRPYISSLTQYHVDPPRFQMLVNEPGAVAHAYLRYIEGRMRKEFDFTGIPISFKLVTAREVRP